MPDLNRQERTLKSFFSPQLVRRLAGDIARVYPEFSQRAFVRDATRGLDALELLDRGRQIGRALAAHLPQEYPSALRVLLRSLGPEQDGDGNTGAGMAPFYYLPHLIFISERGLDHFELSMDAQHELTRRFTAEFSIRHFIARDPERCMAILARWAEEPNPHVRRLVSEGTRLRLPWGIRVAWLDAHPERVLPLLDRLKDDPSPMVRRSVANNLNDLGKVRPDLLIRTATKWLRGAGADRRALVEHALRTAVKRGERGALDLLGYGGAPDVVLEAARFDPPRVPIGSRVTMTFTIRSTSKQPQGLLVDAAVHFLKARGTGKKVFKLTRLTLAPKARAPLKVSFSLAVHTTRVPRPGRHAVDVLVNGRAIPAGSFEVIAASPSRARAGPPGTGPTRSRRAPTRGSARR